MTPSTLYVLPNLLISVRIKTETILAFIAGYLIVNLHTENELKLNCFSFGAPQMMIP